MSKETMRGIHSFAQQVGNNSFIPPYLRRLGIEDTPFANSIDRKEYVARLGEFDLVCERFHSLLRQKEDSNLPAVDDLRTKLQGRVIPSFFDFVSDIGSRVERKDEEVLNLMFVIKGLWNEVRGGNQERDFSRVFIFSYSRLFQLVIGYNTQDIQLTIRNGIHEVIRNHFPNTQLVQDLDFQAVSLADATAEGRSPNDFVRGYENISQLAALCREVGINDTEIIRRILNYDRDANRLRDPWVAIGIIELLTDNSSDAQHEFGMNFFEFGKERFENLRIIAESTGRQDVAQNIISILNGDFEEYDVQAWWMFAPYVFEALHDISIKQGEEFDPSVAIDRILLWAGTNRPRGEMDIKSLHLEGLQLINQSGQFYRLSKNPEGASHMFTKQVARRIADLLLREDKFDPEKAFL